jgi:hypothetical protein
MPIITTGCIVIRWKKFFSFFLLSIFSLYFYFPPLRGELRARETGGVFRLVSSVDLTGGEKKILFLEVGWYFLVFI